MRLARYACGAGDDGGDDGRSAVAVACGVPRVPAVRTAPSCDPSSCALRGRLAFQVKRDDLGQEMPVPAVPLERELDVAAGGVAVVVRVLAQVIPAVDHRRAVEELEEPDRDVPVVDRHVPVADGGAGVEPVDRLVPVIVPTPAIADPAPLVPAVHVTTVDAVEAVLVEVRRVEEAPEFARQDDVGVQV